MKLDVDYLKPARRPPPPEGRDGGARAVCCMELHGMGACGGAGEGVRSARAVVSSCGSGGPLARSLGGVWGGLGLAACSLFMFLFLSGLGWAAVRCCALLGWVRVWDWPQPLSSGFVRSAARVCPYGVTGSTGVMDGGVRTNGDIS